MKRIVLIGMALAFSLGIAGLGFSEEKGMVPMKHDDVKICANVNCCGGQEKAKEAISSKKAEEGSSTSWEDQLKVGADGPTVIK